MINDVSRDGEIGYVRRKLNLKDVLEKKSCFLFGPRQTGKSSLIRHELDTPKVYNLLDSATLLTLSRNPQRIREELSPRDKVIVIDEIQKLPSLLDEVHLLIEEKGLRFLLTGSSARKLRRGGVNLLGGRARSRHLHPFIQAELSRHFDLTRALNFGLLPSIYFSDDPNDDLKTYAGDYLKEEIAQEGLTRNIPAFSRFLEVAALCHGTMINHTEISNDAQVARTTVIEYFQILKDTLIAHELPAWKATKKRKPIVTSKFYLFDNGVARILQGRKELAPKTKEFGDAFEAYLFHELRAFVDYGQVEGLHYWRSTSNYEVDFILGDALAVETKAGSSVHTSDLKGLKALQEEKSLKHYVLVNTEDRPRRVDGIDIMPWKDFLERLWAREFV